MKEIYKNLICSVVEMIFTLHGICQYSLEQYKISKASFWFIVSRELLLLSVPIIVVITYLEAMMIAMLY